MPATLPAARQLVVFSLCGEEYAIPITRVQEIIGYTRPRPVVAHDRSLCGVISLRGKVLPVFDLASRLELEAPPGHAPEEPKIVIVEGAGDRAGVIVDDVEQVLTVGEDDGEAMAGTGAGLDSIIRIGDRLIILLDLDAMFGTGDEPA